MSGFPRWCGEVPRLIAGVLVYSASFGCAAASKPEVVDCMAREDSGDFRGALTACQTAAIKYRESQVGTMVASRLPMLLRLQDLKAQIDRQKERVELIRTELKLRKRLQRLEKPRKKSSEK